ncbi:hypothetical protein FHS42_005665 [Streptomyces zagrosensis]|uniref:Uncharacterized protein n=1 Tax=Streptomyces zagrosensis TaxID=1042984 RepID=A0A7W9QE17_9ACTN|nr:hypothetical protein [Streptomyces zagrosensis]
MSSGPPSSKTARAGMADCGIPASLEQQSADAVRVYARPRLTAHAREPVIDDS